MGKYPIEGGIQRVIKIRPVSLGLLILVSNSVPNLPFQR